MNVAGTSSPPYSEDRAQCTADRRILDDRFDITALCFDVFLRSFCRNIDARRVGFVLIKDVTHAGLRRHEDLERTLDTICE